MTNLLVHYVAEWLRITSHYKNQRWRSIPFWLPELYHNFQETGKSIWSWIWLH